MPARSRKTAAPEAPIARRTRRSTEDLTSRLIETAAQEFKRLGYDGATTASIARKAEVTEAQLFRYYGSKANLFREAIFKPLDEQLAEFTRTHLSENAANTRENAGLYIEELRRFLASNVDMLTSLIVLQTYDREAAEGVAAIESLGKYFDRGAATMAGDRRRPLPVPPELMVRVSFAAVLACVMFKSWIFPPGVASEQDIEAAIQDFVLAGININHAD
jgi:AcrR family transcriptional regulator